MAKAKESMKRAFLNGTLIVLMTLLAVACRREPPEQRLRDTLAQMQAAVEAGDTAAFMRPVAEDFIGNSAIDRAQLEQMLRAQLLLDRTLGVTAGPLTIDVTDSTAVVRFSVLLSGGRGRFMPERGQLQSITSGWRQVDGDWRLYYAQWQPQAGSDPGR
jgi:ketosteroid isomerase-like protein